MEAGLRTGYVQNPFPEEMNRLLTTRLTSLHFPATASAAENLRREGVPVSSIFLTGNPVIDAVQRLRRYCHWQVGGSGMAVAGPV